MGHVLSVAHCRLNGWDLQLLWNGRAFFAWKETGLALEEIDSVHSQALVTMLAIMAREGAAAARIYGYQVDEPPTRDELQAYFDGPEIMPYEILGAYRATTEALRYGNTQSYKTPDGSGVDVTTLELKKN